MTQADADRRRFAMAALAAMGWNTHVWYEPAVGPVDWRGWEFIRQVIVGGESGEDARPFRFQWGLDTITWGQANHVAVYMKQVGSRPLDGGMKYCCEQEPKKGGDPADWPRDLRVRELRLFI